MFIAVSRIPTDAGSDVSTCCIIVFVTSYVFNVALVSNGLVARKSKQTKVEIAPIMARKIPKPSEKLWVVAAIHNKIIPMPNVNIEIAMIFTLYSSSMLHLSLSSALSAL